MISSTCLLSAILTALQKVPLSKALAYWVTVTYLADISWSDLSITLLHPLTASVFLLRRTFNTAQDAALVLFQQRPGPHAAVRHSIKVISPPEFVYYLLGSYSTFAISVSVFVQLQVDEHLSPYILTYIRNLFKIYW